MNIYIIALVVKFGDLLDQLKGLNREKGVTFVLSSHDPLVISQARRVVRLRDGRLESDTEGSP